MYILCTANIALLNSSAGPDGPLPPAWPRPPRGQPMQPTSPSELPVGPPAPTSPAPYAAEERNTRHIYIYIYYVVSRRV